MTHDNDEIGSFNMHPEYRDAWVAAGYRDDMGSAVTCKPPGPDFLRLYHITNAEFAASNLWFGRLKVARLNELNDPFEFLGVVNRKKGGWFEAALAAKTAAHDEYGLLCFSEDWTSPALWSHYGDKHQGICLGFNIRRSLVFKVDYQPNRVEKARSDRNRPAETLDIREQLRVKSADWSYEREWRADIKLAEAQQHGPLHFIPFSTDIELAEVILGERCNLPIREMRIKTLQSYPRACVIKSRLARQHFSVVPDEDTIPPCIA